MAATIRLNSVLARHARERPSAPALAMWRAEAPQPALGYAALAARVASASAHLQAQGGLRRGDRVAYLGFNDVDEIVLLFALAAFDAILLPLNYRLAMPEWQAVLADAAPACLLHDAAWSAAATDLGAQTGVPVRLLSDALGLRPGAATQAGAYSAPAGAALDDTRAATGPDTTASAPGTGLDASAPGDTPVLLVYTSGTTGRPRGALHTQGNLLANMQAASAAQALTPHDTVATVLPLFHVGGLCIQTLPALYAGARVLLHPRFDPSDTLACIARDRPTLTLQVPATMKALVEHPAWHGTDLRSLRAVWAGSSVLPAALVQAFLARGVPLCNVYGATETGPFSVALPPAQAHSHVGSCGWPVAGVALRLEAPRDGVGEVLLRGPNIVQHYWPDRPALDADGWFRTGDLGRLAADGSLTIVGRAKDMIISGGENIYPAEIEHALATHPLVAECAVLGQPDPRWGEIPVAVVVLHEPPAGTGATGTATGAANANANGSVSAATAAAGAGVAPWEQQLADHLQPLLARYKLPRRWVRVDALPKTALGKVQKAALVQLLQEQAQAG